MAWTVPKYSRTKVNWAGDVITGKLWKGKPFDEKAMVEDMTEAFQIVENWRSSHAFPLNTFQIGLRVRARPIDRDVIVAQRLKRFPSIMFKLLRPPGMDLARMQDIGGCRAIVRNVEQVQELREAHVASRMKHELVKEDDYISWPKDSGYRGIHLIYRYHSDRNDTYNKHLIEIQMRTRLQHVWATAVETVGTFLERALKASEGPKPWLDLFRDVSAAFALQERTPPVPGAPASVAELRAVIKERARALDVASKLQVYQRALQDSEVAAKDAAYFLLSLDPPLLKITGFKQEDLKTAQDAYSVAEGRLKDKPGAQAVLVRVGSLASLRRSYPNYFLDTESFRAELAKLTR